MTTDPTGGGLAAQRILVTGGTGFIGGRLLERLIEDCDAEPAAVRVLIREPSTAFLAARYPVEFVRGDVLDAESLASAAAGRDVVFHCAYGTGGSRRHRRRVNRKGTRHVAEASLSAGVDRLVHLSTLMVYGETPDGDLDETAPRQRFGESYADSKLEAEELVFELVARRGLRATVLQPTAVYGPRGGVWTERVLREIASGRVILVDGGEGLCNAVYVDDLVSAMLSAAVVEEALGEAFLVSGPEPVTWRRFFAQFEELLGVEDRTVTMSAAEARAHWRRRLWRGESVVTELLRLLRDEEVRERLLATREVGLARQIAAALLPAPVQRKIKDLLAGTGAVSGAGDSPSADDELPIHPLTPNTIRFFRTRTRVRTDKAQRVLGYEPRFDLDAGFRRTALWAQWADLV